MVYAPLGGRVWDLDVGIDTGFAPGGSLAAGPKPRPHDVEIEGLGG